MKERIRLLRETLGLTQRAMGEAIGLKDSTIATYEIGRSRPSGAALRAICDKFGVNMDWLLTGDGDMFVKRSPDEEFARQLGELLAAEPDDYRRRFVAAALQLDEQQLKALISAIEALAKAIKKDPD